MNIWEVVCVSDLIKILKTSPQQFIIVGIVLDIINSGVNEYKKLIEEGGNTLL